MSDEDRMSQKNFFRWQACIMGARVLLVLPSLRSTPNSERTAALSLVKPDFSVHESH
jgi:hypothetical protein